jgi:hypothetical protein
MSECSECKKRIEKVQSTQKEEVMKESSMQLQFGPLLPCYEEMFSVQVWDECPDHHHYCNVDVSKYRDPEYKSQCCMRR